MKTIQRKSLLALLAFGTVLSGSLFAQARPAARPAPQVIRPAVVSINRPAIMPRPFVVVPRGPVVRETPRHDPQDRIQAARIQAARIKAARITAARIKAAREAAANQPHPRRRAHVGRN